MKSLVRIRELLLLTSFFASGCTLELALHKSVSLPPTVTAHKINEVVLDEILLELEGQCPEDVLQVRLLVEGETLNANCDPSTLTFTVNYKVPHPNNDRLILFEASSVYPDGKTVPTTYEVNYKRPSVPSPIITSNSGRDFVTNDTTPFLQGTCLSEKTNGMEVKIGGGAWSNALISCTSGTWSLTLPVLTGNPETDHLIQVRSLNSLSQDPYSEPDAITIRVDTVPPNPPLLPAAADAGVRPVWTWVSGGGGGNGVYRYKLNDSDLSSGATVTTSLSYASVSDVAFGTHTLYVQERDEAGNWSASGIQVLTVKCGPGNYLSSGSCVQCAPGTYQPSNSISASCVSAGTGTYVDSAGANTVTACTNKPAHAASVSYGASSGLTSNSCPIVSIDTCETNYTQNGLTCRALCATDKYWDGSACADVGSGFYSPANNDTRYACTNVPVHATAVVYSGSGSGANSCPVSSVLTCDIGYDPSGDHCTDNTPDALVFAAQSGVELSTLTTSNTLTLGGFDGPLIANCTGCSAIARNGVWGGTSVGGFLPGDTITIRRTSSSSFSTAVTAQVTLGNVTSNAWLVTTRAALSCTSTPWGTLAHGATVQGFSQSAPTSACSAIAETRTCTDGVLSGSFNEVACNDGCTGTPWGNVAHGYSNTSYAAGLPAGTCVSEVRTCNSGVMSGSYSSLTCTAGCSLPWSGGISSGQSVTAYLSTNPTGACTSENRSCNAGALSGSYTAQSCNAGCAGTPWGNVSHGFLGTAYSATYAVAPTTCASLSQARGCTNGSMAGSYTITSCQDYAVVSLSISYSTVSFGSLGDQRTTATITPAGGVGSGGYSYEWILGTVSNNNGGMGSTGIVTGGGTSNSLSLEGRCGGSEMTFQVRVRDNTSGIWSSWSNGSLQAGRWEGNCD
ncbi:hypothetical protein ACLWBD_10215 [Bdellovibrio sp. HCB117]|uniref:hypothetical protein n=1 Tax=Bdellovibrio sp. HCB117 TaxID=3394359 RepID=UPI0039B6D070